MKWKKIGNILIIDENLQKEYAGRLDELLSIHNVDTIAKINNITGQMRKPNIDLLIGDKTETIHKENGCFFKLDITKIMWSKGNTTERMRIANLVQDNEIVVDMFAGIGYFSIPIAKYSNVGHVFAIEINPDSYHYLNENISLNKINNKSSKNEDNCNIMEAILGDSAEVAPKLSADRIIMGYVKTTHEFLDSAMECLKPEGIIHYHETVPEKLMNTRPINRIKKAANGREVEVLSNRIIKKYSPGVVHTVTDVKIY